MTPIMLLIAILVFTLIGCGFGILTGLIPGIHVNNVAHMVLVSETAIIGLATMVFGWAEPNMQDLIIIISSLIIGTVVTHTFLDFIPSVFLGAPDGDTALSVLPGHRMMMAGRGFEAVKCSVTGSFGAMIFCLILLVPLRLFIGQPVNAYANLESFIHLVLLCVSAFLILGESARAREEFNFNDVEMTGFVMSGAVGAGDCAHEGMALPEIDGMEPDRKEMVAVQGVVENVLDDEGNSGDDNDDNNNGQTSIVLRDNKNKKKINVRLHKWNTRVPEIGDEVVVMGQVTARVTWKDHMLKRGMALGIFVLSGILGMVLLSPSGLVGQNLYFIRFASSDTGIIFLFPMFTGLFGLSTLLLSLKDKPAIPEQEVDDVKVNVSPRRQLKSIMSGCLASVSSLFPGISSAIATMIAVNLHGDRDSEGEGGQPPKKNNIGGRRNKSQNKSIKNEKKDETSEFIISVSSVNTSVGIFNLLALFIIMKSRSGAMKAVEAIMGSNITPWAPISNVPLELASLLFAALIASIVALWLTLKFGRIFAKNFSKINYQKMVLGVIIFLIVMIAIFSGVLGLAILGITTFMGFIPPLVGVKRVHLMGSLVVPVILYFL
ncbi:MAG: tripartite tricarboxylate transporter permease [Thermoplasmata archaeon]|nr:tripartite tricarboxylate transporter permease [Thermoplasmata archaeon]